MNDFKVALCVCVKCENLYLKEWIEYYKKLGFDKICIYDNNEFDGEDIHLITKPYEKDGFVEVNDLIKGGKKGQQANCFHDFYGKNKKNYDWIAFFDVDEFLVLKKHDNIKEYLKQEHFEDVHQILINWVCFTDNNKLYYEEGNVVERFTEPLSNDIRVEKYEPDPSVKTNDAVKCIIHSKLFQRNFPLASAHRMMDAVIKQAYGITLKTVNNCGDIINYYNHVYCKHNEEDAYVAHYVTKSAEEYAWKMKRGDVNNIMDRVKKNFFFGFNKYSKEKEDIIDKIIGPSK